MTGQRHSGCAPAGVGLAFVLVLLLVGGAVAGQSVDRGEQPGHLTKALSFVGTVERGGSNRGPEVNAFLRSVGLGPGYSWCAAFTTYCLRNPTSGPPRDVTDSRGRSVLGAGATRHLQGRGTTRARDVLRGVYRPEPGELVVWRRGSGWQGHIGFFVVDDNAAVRGEQWYGRCGWTVEGNTSSGVRGSQSDGDGVYRRLRCIEPGSYFKIEGFVRPDPLPAPAQH